MFDSKITVAELIEGLQNEVDIALDIPTKSYIQWLNGLEQLLYSEIINEQKKHNIDPTCAFAEFAKARPELKLNLWPLFDSQTSGDVTLNVSEDGTYKLTTTGADFITGTGAVFEKDIALPPGEYMLSDNALPYGGDISSMQVRTCVSKTRAGEGMLAVIRAQDPPDTGDSIIFAGGTLELRLCIHVAQGANIGADGYIFRPQIEVGDTRTAFIPPVSAANTEGIPVIACSLPANASEAVVRFEDIHAVYADDTQLMKSTLASGVIFPDTYFKDDNKLGLHFTKIPKNITLIYRVRPALKTPDTISTTNVRVPVEFIDLVKAKLRGEAYKLANEGELAAMWLNDYNVLLETFKAWVSEKQSEFGM
jgi:hypothetical protein